MKNVSVAQAKAQLSALIEQVADGTSVRITRRGKPIARITPLVPLRKRVDAAALRAMVASMPPARKPVREMVLRMRDSY